ncbi:MAG: glycosyltransferase [Nitrososphaeria archaeon]
MRVGVIYDFGVNKGGGDFVMLNILEALIKAYDTTLITSKLSGFYEAEEFFDKKINRIGIHEIKKQSLFRHPYTIAQMARDVKEGSYDLFVLSDDIPKCLANKRVLSYIHYPHVARLKFGGYMMRKYVKTFKGRVEWWLHKKFFRLFYPVERISDKWLLVVNSMVTMEDTMKIFKLGGERLVLLNPPVSSAFINALYKNSHITKEDLIVSIGWFEPVKGLVDVVKALALLEDEYRPNLRLIGFAGDETYLKELIKTAEILGVKNKVDIFLNARRDVLINSLLRAKVIINSALREHFGISIVEGMAAECIPIVRKGFNGPWMEVLQEGKHGLGFETVEELAFNIKKAVRTYDDFDTHKIALRALEFDEKHFRDRFLEIVKHFLNQ